MNKMSKLIEKLELFVITTVGKITVGGIACVASITLIVAIIISSGSGKNIQADSDTKENISTQEITTVEKVATETPTTTQQQTTTLEVATQEETTTIEVIKVEDLNVSDDDLSKNDEVMRGQEQANMTEPVTVPPTQAPANNQNTSTATPKPAPKPAAPPTAVNEYSCLVYGIDVSKWQGNIDWAKVKAAGYKFVMIKCAGRAVDGNGQLYVDKCFEKNIEGALSNGIQVGVYFFSQALNEREAQEEASLVIDLLKKYKITYPVTFDWETSQGWRTSNTYIGKNKFTNIVNTFCNMVKQAGYEPMVYGNYNDLYRFDIESIARKHKVWYARWWDKYQKTSANYKDGEDTPILNFAYQMWQYKSTGRVPGISGNVDMNVAFFSYSGSGVPSRALELLVKNKSLISNVGTSISLKNGVVAKSTAGTDISSSVTYAIKNSSNVVVNESTAINTPGRYTITYNITDFTGATKNDTASLVVRSKPVIELNQNEIVYLKSTDYSEKNANDIAREVQTLITNNIKMAKDYEGNNIRAAITIEYPKVLYLENSNGQKLTSVNDLSDAVLSSGEYVIKYSVKDSRNLVSTAQMSLKIIDIKEREFEFDVDEANGDRFAEMLNDKLAKNTTIINSNMKYILSEALQNAINKNSFMVGENYEVMYIVTNLDSNVYYRKVNIKIRNREEETSEETTQENNESVVQESVGE